jgi:hypothetical protein
LIERSRDLESEWPDLGGAGEGDCAKRTEAIPETKMRQAACLKHWR